MVAGYKAATGIVADCFVCAPSDGALALRAAAMAGEGGEMKPLTRGGEIFCEESAPEVQSAEAGVGAGFAEQDAEAVAGTDGEDSDAGCAAVSIRVAICVRGMMRAGGARTDVYTSTYVFENDFAALKPDVPDVRIGSGWAAGCWLRRGRVGFAG